MKNKYLALISLVFLTACTSGGGSTSPDEPTDPDTPYVDPDTPQEKPVSYIPDVGEVRLLFSTGEAGKTQIYNYCPSIFIENNEEHVYFCTNKDEGNVTDYVGYRKGTISDNKINFPLQSDFVLSHGTSSTSWDYRHACDPSVIKGEFKFHGETYNYLMAYLGCVPSDCTLNETGIAVSKSPQGPWIKCDFKEDGVTKINPIVPYKDFQVGENNWGTGQPSLFSVDKKGRVILLTTVGAQNGTFTNAREYDFSDIDNFKLIREKNNLPIDGIKGTRTGASFINNADFGYDYQKRRVILAKPRQFFGTDGKSPDFIADTIDVYYIDDTEGSGVGDILFAGNNTVKIWKSIGSIDSKLTGFLRNHNCGLITDAYGGIDSSLNLGVAFTRSDEASGNNWTYLSTYRIYATAFNFPKNY
ncbi:MAG: hypothetical protein IJ186_03320 [Bacilli bacterium]|nr:hypothetical protein [Bacilli bacterium]